MSRNPARKGPADSNHRAIREAIEAIGCPVMDLSAAGNGVEDLLVGLRKGAGLGVHWVNGERKYHRYDHWWVVVECKVPSASGRVKYEPAQLKWRALTEGWPRITATSAQDAVDQIRRLQG